MSLATPPHIESPWRFPCCPEPPNWSLDWEAVCDLAPNIAALHQCPQDPIHHAEGDVGTHTKMVCEALASLNEWRALPSQERSILFAGALLHDIAKPRCTRAEGGRITSRGHARQGARLARLLLWRHNGEGPIPTTPLTIRESVADLVRLHGLPLNWPNEPDLLRQLYSASWRTRLDHLAMLAEADVLGRTCSDQQTLLDRVSLFRELAEEHQCLSQPRRFASDHTRFLYFQGRNLNPDYPAYEAIRNDAILMSGLPGAGKDTWIAQNAGSRPVISLDHIRRELGVSPTDGQAPVIEQAKNAAKGYLRQGEPFIWNATNLTKAVRDTLVQQFAAYDARVTIVHLNASWSDLLKRNRIREHAVPERVLIAMSQKLETPSRVEAHQVTFADHSGR